MDADWSVAAAVDDPVIVVPWLDDVGIYTYVDLRAAPDRVEQVPETAQWPELSSALLLLNAPASGMFTSKCDAWELSDEEKLLDFGPVSFGIGSYIDLLYESDKLFASLEKQVMLLKQIAMSAAHLDHANARAEFILRPARKKEAAGFGTTVYVYGYGENPDEARARWAMGLADVVGVILRETLE